MNKKSKLMKWKFYARKFQNIRRKEEVLKSYLNKRSHDFEVKFRVEELDIWVLDGKCGTWLSDDSLG